MRRVEHLDDLAEALLPPRARRCSAFGFPSVFLGKAVVKPRHIEARIQGDASAAVVHLYYPAK